MRLSIPSCFLLAKEPSRFRVKGKGGLMAAVGTLAILLMGLVRFAPPMGPAGTIIILISTLFTATTGVASLVYHQAIATSLKNNQS